MDSGPVKRTFSKERMMTINPSMLSVMNLMEKSKSSYNTSKKIIEESKEEEVTYSSELSVIDEVVKE